jgi:thiamine pyrophosphate-dependent acetolactate synthase large subunit-like protein
MKVYDAVASALAAEQCQTLFGVMGDGNMSLWGALGRDGKIELVSARNEAGAVAMADGYSRTTGKVGLATITCGPGLTQVGTSLVAAARNRSPIVLVIGEIPEHSPNTLQRLDQRRFVEACEARYQNVTSAENLAAEIAEAFYAARAHRMPVVLNVPNDLYERELDWEFDYKPSARFIPPSDASPGEASVAALADRLASSRRPVILAGAGALASGAKEAILKLAERVGALLATSLKAKGMFAGEPYDLGICGTFSAEPAERLLSQADFVLAVGAEVGYYTSEGGFAFPSADVARIDVRAAPDSIGFMPGMYVRGDARETVAALDRVLASRGFRQEGARTAQTRGILQSPAPSFDTPSDGIDPRALSTALTGLLPEGCLVTCGAAHFFSFPIMYLGLPEGGEINFSYQLGAVGQTLPIAIGIGMAHPGRPHVLIEGDGSLLMHIQELDTAARAGIPLVVLVWNDGGYGAEVHKLRAKGFDPALAQWPSADFAAIARGFGGDGMRIDALDELAPAVRRGLASKRLFVIDARVSPSVMSDPYEKLHYGMPNRAPLLRPVPGR